LGLDWGIANRIRRKCLIFHVLNLDYWRRGSPLKGRNKSLVPLRFPIALLRSPIQLPIPGKRMSANDYNSSVNRYAARTSTQFARVPLCKGP
jgi:hypothetical protein